MKEPEEGGDGEINDGLVNLAFIGVEGQVEPGGWAHWQGRLWWRGHLGHAVT